MSVTSVEKHLIAHTNVCNVECEHGTESEHSCQAVVVSTIRTDRLRQHTDSTTAYSIISYAYNSVYSLALTVVSGQ